MYRIGTYVQSIKNQFDTVVRSEENSNSTSSSQQDDQNNNEEIHTATVDHTNKLENALKIETGILNTNHHLVEARITPTTFSQFGKFPTELRLKIWRYASLQPRIIQLTTCNDEEVSNCSFLINDSQQCPFTRTCRESRDVVLSFKEPVPLGQKPLSVPCASIYTNPNLDILWLRPLTPFSSRIREVAICLRRFVGVQRVILSVGYGYREIRLGQVMPGQDNRAASHDAWALMFDLQDIYYLLEDENFSNDDEGVEVPHLFESSTEERKARSLKEIEEAYAASFNYHRMEELKWIPSTVEQYDVGKEEAAFMKLFQERSKRLEAWKMPRIKYMKESQVNALLR